MAARGPLPKPDARRRNPPTIPTTSLPVSGRKGKAPACPYPLAKAGKAWWRWAWKTPQSAAWDPGAVYAVGRRAQLEDDLAALDLDSWSLGDLLGLDKSEALKELSFLVQRLKGMAGGRISVMKEMRELDGRLGLTPDSLARLRWTIVADEEQKPASKRPTSRGRLRAVS